MYLAHQVLADAEDFAAAELGHQHRFRQLLAHLEVVLDFQGVAEGNFAGRILHLAVVHNHAVAEDFQVAFVDVDDDVEVVLRAEVLGQRGAEYLFEDAHQRFAVDVFKFLEFLKGTAQV